MVMGYISMPWHANQHHPHHLQQTAPHNSQLPQLPDPPQVMKMQLITAVMCFTISGK